MMWDLWDRIEGPLLGFVLVTLLSLVAIAVLSLPAWVIQDARQHKEFMDQCTQERPEYECVAMWRTGAHL